MSGTFWKTFWSGAAADPHINHSSFISPTRADSAEVWRTFGAIARWRPREIQWFSPRQRRIGRHDSTSSSCPTQPFQPRLCPFSRGTSGPLPSSSVAVDWPPLETPGYPLESLSRDLVMIHAWNSRERCPNHADLGRIYWMMLSTLGSAVTSLTCHFVLAGDLHRILRCHL